MTKERRIAIAMWTEIARKLEDEEIFEIAGFKKEYLYGTGIEWKNGCWFCQYMRRDYRAELPSRRRISLMAEGCSDCPMFRNSYVRLAKDACGCDTLLDTIYRRVDLYHDAEPAWKIVELLGGTRDEH